MNTHDEQTWMDYTLGKDLISNGEKPYVSQFYCPQTHIVWNGSGYGVYATEFFDAGDIVEEMPALVIRTTIEDVVDKCNLNDPILLSKVLVYPTVHPVFNKLGHPLILPIGNFFAYNQRLESNAEVEFNRKFNIVTIRAKKPINQHEEIILTSYENKYGHTDISIDTQNSDKTKTREKKDMGCGCGKKKKAVTKILDGTEKSEIKEEVKKEKPVLENNNKFKSMVDGSVLRTIKSKKKT